MNTNADSELDTLRLLQTSIEVSHGSKNFQTSSDSPLCIIFMGVGIAEIDEQTVTEQLGDMPIVALDDFCTSRLIRTDHVTPVFRVELAGQLGGIHEVAEHHSELAAFGVRPGRDDWCGLALCRSDVRRGRQRH